MAIQQQKVGLTHPQQRIWYTEKLHPGTGMWNNAGTLKIKGHIDYPLLEKALNIFLKENDSIRLRIGVDTGVPYQYIAPYEFYHAEVFDFSELGLDKVYDWDNRQTRTPMPLVENRLYYFAFLKVSSNECGLYAKFHHIISDALSIVEFSNQVMENYRRLLDGENVEVTPRPSYMDYVENEQNYLSSKRFIYDKDYWTARFEQFSEPTILKPKKMSDMRTTAQRKVFVITESLAKGIRDFCKSAGVSVFALFLSALAIYINRITGKKDVIIGAPVANRSTLAEKAMFGMFVSMVPVRIDISDELSFSEFSQVVSNEWFSALKHQKYPFDILMHELHQRYKNLDALYDVTLSYQYGKFVKTSDQFRYEGRWHFSGNQAGSLNIHVNDREDEGRFILDYDHLTPLYYDKEIGYFHNHLINIIRDMILHPDKPLYMLDLMSEEERKRITQSFNDTDRSYPRGETLTEVLQRGIGREPDGTAIVCAGETLSYRELDARSDALASHLVSCGVGPESVVGLVVGRSMEYCVSVVAILKAGGAFLPIDPELPPERIAYMLSDSGVKILLASPEHVYKCPGRDDLRIISTAVRVKAAEEVVPSACGPNNLAYIIYTSGSTGQPKGVQIEHHSIAHFVYSMEEIWDLSPGGKLLCAASVSFDISVMELVLAFSHGLTLVLAQEHEVNVPRSMVQLIQTAGVNMMVVTPGRMEMLLSDRQGESCIENFREIGTGGDVLSEKLLARIQQSTRARITNFYGPTEITVCCTCIDVTHARIPSIGRPMPDVKAYILDAHRNPVPVGVPGELYIGGPGVARGYINKPELTKDRFIKSPFYAGTLYRTGDLVRWYPQGEIEFLGRIDKQVKIRGYRIELGEIEDRLLKIPGVASCAVTDYSDTAGRRFLCAYLCGKPPRRSELKALLERELPAYMIPSVFIEVDSLPYNISGKVDRANLPDPLAHLEAQTEKSEPPETVTEQMLADIWCAELGLTRVGRDDSFFDLGGDSLSILHVMTQVEQQFHVAFRHEDVYRAPRLCDMAAVIDAAEQSSYRPILPAPARRDYPVSSAQQRMWVVSQAGQNSVAYNIPVAFDIDGKLDVRQLETAFQQLIARHESLRTSFVLRGGNLRQHIHKSVVFRLETIQCEKRAVKRTLKSLIKPFDMSNAPLMHAVLLKTAPRQHILFMEMHHSVCDQPSLEILLRELAAFYRGESLPPIALEYKDYAVWQEEFMRSESMAMQREYWKGVLSGELPLLNLHTDKPRPAKQRFEGARYAFSIDAHTAKALRSFAQRHGGTFFMTVLAVYNVLLMKYTGQEDIIVGTPTSGRTREELRGMTGVFINTLPLRCHPRGEQSFLSFYQDVLKTCAAAFSNEDCPLERMVTDIALQRDASRNPLFDTMLIVARDDAELTLGDTRVCPLPFEPGFAKLDLTLEIYEHNHGLQCYLEYGKRLFKRSTIKRIAAHFVRLATLLPEAPDTLLCNADMLSQQELNGIVREFNRTDMPLDPNKSIQSIFEAQAQLQPDKTALIADGKSMTFAELNARANVIAHMLRAKGVARNTIVALSLKRSLDLIAAMLGVWKAGGGYLPLDISYPTDRVSYMLSNCGTKILLSDGSADIPFDGEVIRMEEMHSDKVLSNPDRVDGMDDIAYVMYTSGSTGLPKGTVLHRKGLLNFYEGVKGPVDYQAAQTSISITTVSFDIFICDAILPLLNGSTLVLCTEEELRQPHLVAELINRHDIKFIEATPTRMRAMLEDSAFRSAMSAHIEKIMVGGEMVPLSLVKLLRKHCPAARIINAYGPTETTVYSSFQELTKATRITIGHPILNTRFYVLDKNMQPVPIGVLGEAYISGFGVAKGYINREDLNRKAFMPDPFWPGQMMYKTGDVCAFLEDGDMEMCGRVDHQVKIRGLRIELGEIEATIRGAKGVEDAVVKDWGEGAEKYLCAYYVGDSETDAEAIRAHIIRKLPLYMIPSFFIPMEVLPTTLNGKVNRKALPEPQRNAVQGVHSRPEGMSADEKRMAKIWSRVLKVKDIGPEDNFFTLGGDSLAVIKVQAAALQYGWSLRTQDFYDFKTLRSICARAGTKGTSQKKENGRSGMSAIPDFPHIQPIPMKRVLLTGATGYLGAHLLGLLAREVDCRIACIVRGQDLRECEKNLARVLKHYFGEISRDEILARTEIIQGDITQDNFGFDDSVIERLGSADTLLHSAALTDHIGQSSTFTEINVDGTRNAMRLAKKLGASLVHISTISVSGTRYADDARRKGIFTEANYNIRQNYEDNEYVRSKFLAEGIVLDEMKEGLNARIFRVGVLTSTMDGHFQIRREKNAFANRVKAMCAIGSIPLGMLEKRIEMTPVDACAQAIVTLSRLRSDMKPVYHVYNTNTLTIAELVGYLEAAGQRITIVSDEEFEQIVLKMSRSGKYAMLSGLFEDLTIEEGEENIRVSADVTKQQLLSAGYDWPVIDTVYVRRYIESIQ